MRNVLFFFLFIEALQLSTTSKHHVPDAFFFQFLLFFAVETKQEYKDSQEKPVHGKSAKVCLRGLKFQNSDHLKFKFR